jgi:hypothetical protein
MKFVRFYWIVLILVLLSSCRTPSKTRFEKITGIELSDSITVIEDKFEESGPDYGLTYIILISKKDCSELSKKLENYKGWKQNGRNWEFHETANGIMYDIIFSITDCKITYNENLI